MGDGSGGTAAAGINEDALMSRCISETVAEIIKKYQKHHNIPNTATTIRNIKNSVASRLGLKRTPKLMEILAGVPEEWRKKLQPFLTAKPIRSASGISVVAVMSKPHRCPHIAMTGNICIYCFTPDHQLLTVTGFKYVAEITEADVLATYNEALERIEYHHPSRVYEKPGTHDIVDIINRHEQLSWSNEDDYTVRRVVTASTDTSASSSVASSRASSVERSVDDAVVSDSDQSDTAQSNPPPKKKRRHYRASSADKPVAQNSNHIALSVTSDHDVYVRRGKRSGNDNLYGPWATIPAADLVSNDERAITKLLCNAKNGIADPLMPPVELQQIRTHLSLSTDDQWMAFVELFGYWLGDGTLSLRQRSPGVGFNTVKDTVYVGALLARLPLTHEEDYTVRDYENGYWTRLAIYNKVWVKWFVDEYGKKYLLNFTVDVGIDLATKSVKWTPNWCWQLNASESKAWMTGLAKADGHVAKGGDNMPVKTGGEIYTSSVAFRDDIVRMSIHSGYAVYFINKYKKGAIRNTIKYKKGQRDVPHATPVAKSDSWRVVYSNHIQAAQPVINNAKEVATRTYEGPVYCVTVPNHKVIARKAHTGSAGVITKASRPTIIGNCPGGPDSDFEYSTQAYTGYEPTSMRAIRSRYDPFRQTRDRVEQLQRLGHDVDKVEFIVMGGTFMSLDAEYRDYFIRNLHDALSGHTSSSVDEAIHYSEQSQTKCVALTIETRPDYFLKPHISQLLSYGCTRVEIGVQSVYEDVARDTNRGHTVRAVSESLKLAKDAGYKIICHMMPDLPNMGLERDLEQFVEFFSNPAFRADGLKLYPTLVIRGTGLYELWKTGKYRNYSPDTLIDLLAQILALCPPWTRIYRIQRDIPMPLVTSGVEHGNIRELVLKRMQQQGLTCRDVRTREIGIVQVHAKAEQQTFEAGQVELVRRDYTANGGWETFLAYEDAAQDVLIGLLRLRKCTEESTYRAELVGQPTSVVRELHVYGSSVPVHTRDPLKFQHQGYGQLLMEEAERIARDEHGSDKIAVISGVGTRHYYRKLGYVLEGPYMVKWLT